MNVYTPVDFADVIVRCSPAAQQLLGERDPSGDVRPTSHEVQPTAPSWSWNVFAGHNAHRDAVLS